MTFVWSVSFADHIRDELPVIAVLVTDIQDKYEETRRSRIASYDCAGVAVLAEVGHVRVAIETNRNGLWRRALFGFSMPESEEPPAPSYRLQEHPMD